VGQAASVPTVLILDDDLGFVWWLGEIFRELGYNAVPALSSSQALSMIKAWDLRVDLAVLNPDLPGISPMIKAIERAHLAPKIVMIGEPTRGAMGRLAIHGTLERPSGQEPTSRQEWLTKIKLLTKLNAS
jgi:DNA-binding NtrC family response regulator